jgi:hypothetical protein
MIITIGHYKLDVDVGRTRAANSLLKPPNQECECDVCQNFVPSISKADSKILDFFESFGLDPKKASEVMQYGPVSNGEMLCAGFYHIVGVIIEPKESSQNDNNEFSSSKIDSEIILPERFEVGFTSDCSLVPEAFPKPHFQLNITVLLPWVMDYPPED